MNENVIEIIQELFLRLTYIASTYFIISISICYFFHFRNYRLNENVLEIPGTVFMPDL